MRYATIDASFPKNRNYVGAQRTAIRGQDAPLSERMFFSPSHFVGWRVFLSRSVRIRSDTVVCTKYCYGHRQLHSPRRIPTGGLSAGVAAEEYD